MRLKVLLQSLCVISVVGLAGCAKYDFSPVDPIGSKLGEDPLVDEGPVVINNPTLVQIQSAQMKLGTSMASFDQDMLDSNRTVVTFQAVDSRGDFLNNLTSTSVTLKENGVNVPGFVMTSNPSAYRQTVDIAFLIDITCSMNPTIASAKTRVIDFIRTSRAAGYHTRMCLSTFGDYTVRRCDRFYDNDPSKPATLTQVEELISEVSRLSAGCGAADPGGRDLDENPMQAVIDAETAPWAAGSQRFGILLTDAGFLYGPGNPGALGASAPRYADVLNSLRRSQINLFAATPSRAGYERNFGTSAGIIPASNGEHFLYTDLVAGRVNMNTILNRILQRVQTTYALEYVSDTVAGLDPTLALNQRNFTVNLSSGSGTVQIVAATSNLPTGRAEYKKKFKLSDKDIDLSSLVVKVNGVEVTSGISVVNGELVFTAAPARGAKIAVEYAYARLMDSLQTQTVVLNPGEDLNAIAVFLNDVKVTGVYVRFEKNLEGQWMLLLNPEALSEDDPFKIRENGGLDVKVFRMTP